MCKISSLGGPCYTSCGRAPSHRRDWLYHGQTSISAPHMSFCASEKKKANRYRSVSTLPAETRVLCMNAKQTRREKATAKEAFASSPSLSRLSPKSSNAPGGNSRGGISRTRAVTLGDQRTFRRKAMNANHHAVLRAGPGHPPHPWKRSSLGPGSGKALIPACPARRAGGLLKAPFVSGGQYKALRISPI